MRIPTSVAVILSFIVCIAAVASAQSTGRISGRVADQTGAVLPGVTVELAVGSRELTATTDDEGGYRFDNVPAGTAELTYRLLNFTVVRRSVNVPPGGAATADVVLTLALSADVVVTGTNTFRNIADVA